MDSSWVGEEAIMPAHYSFNDTGSPSIIRWPKYACFRNVLFIKCLTKLRVNLFDLMAFVIVNLSEGNELVVIHKTNKQAAGWGGNSL